MLGSCWCPVEKDNRSLAHWRCRSKPPSETTLQATPKLSRKTRHARQQKIPQSLQHRGAKPTAAP
eukprot:238779-Lingulodinium_polyedra.AAC.1